MSAINYQSLFDRLWRNPPVFFPIAVLFHAFLFVSGFVQLGDTLDINWPTLAWYLAALIFAVGCLFLQRWAGICYMLLTIAGVLLSRILHVPPFWKSVGATLFPFDVVFSGLLLFFYKRLR